MTFIFTNGIYTNFIFCCFNSIFQMRYLFLFSTGIL
nr:MAG TPA: hypothetical protein [Caudoviricetes sp.]